MIKFFDGDCIEAMKSLKDGSVDFVLTDPPYGITACSWDEVIPFEDMWEQIKRVTKKTGAIALFGREPFSSALRMSNLKNYKYDWIWFKNKPSGMAAAKYRPMTTHEIISVFCYGTHAYYLIKEERDLKPKYDKLKEGDFTRTFYGNNTQNLKDDGREQTRVFSALRGPTTVKKFDVVSNHSGRLHPTQKPVELLNYLIRTYTVENETVLDFAMGSGSTGVAAQQLNRNFIGIDNGKNKDGESWVSVARKRL